MFYPTILRVALSHLGYHELPVLIAAKIYYNQRQLKRSFEDARTQRPIDGDSLSHVAVIIIESGAIYSTLMVILVGTYAAEVTGIFSMFLDMVRFIETSVITF